jgi:hypothetical protein
MVSLRDIPIEHRWMREKYETARRQLPPAKAAAASDGESLPPRAT